MHPTKKLIPKIGWCGGGKVLTERQKGKWGWRFQPQRLFPNELRVSAEIYAASCCGSCCICKFVFFLTYIFLLHIFSFLQKLLKVSVYQTSFVSTNSPFFGYSCVLKKSTVSIFFFFPFPITFVELIRRLWISCPLSKTRQAALSSLHSML